MDGVILLSLIAFFLELATKRNVQLIVFIKNIILNPMILSILIGVFLFVFNFKIDDTPLEYILTTLALCVSPVGLFAIGIILSFHTNNVINKLTASISILKLLISPLVLLLIGYLIFDAGLPQKIPGAFFVSVAPCGVTSIVLCSAYNVNPQNIIKAIFISTFASIGTIFFAIKYLTI
jgi:predicted permease